MTITFLTEDEIRKRLIERFPFLEGRTRVARMRRIFTETPLDQFNSVFKFATGDLGFVMLATITGLDEGNCLGFLYHVATENGIILTIKTAAPKDNPVIDTVTNQFPAAELYERELIDLLGTKVNGLRAGRRYPLPDEWPVDQHPLRKDWKPEQAPAPQPKEVK